MQAGALHNGRSQALPLPFCCSQIDELGLIGQIPQSAGWVFPNSTTELKLGKNRITGPIPPGWRLHQGKMGAACGAACAPLASSLAAVLTR